MIGRSQTFSQLWLLRSAFRRSARLRQAWQTARALVVLVVLAASTIFAQTNAPPSAEVTPPPSASPNRSQAELEKLVAPIALYPDPLLATLLPASAYPIEIVQAARFVKNTNNIAQIDSQPWDENVKALARFPDVIAKLDADMPGQVTWDRLSWRTKKP